MRGTQRRFSDGALRFTAGDVILSVYLQAHCVNLEVLDISGALATSHPAAVPLEALQKGCPKMRVFRAANSQLVLASATTSQQVSLFLHTTRSSFTSLLPKLVVKSSISKQFSNRIHSQGSLEVTGSTVCVCLAACIGSSLLHSRCALFQVNSKAGRSFRIIPIPAGLPTLPLYIYYD